MALSILPLPQTDRAGLLRKLLGQSQQSNFGIGPISEGISGKGLPPPPFIQRSQRLYKEGTEPTQPTPTFGPPVYSTLPIPQPGIRPPLQEPSEAYSGDLDDRRYIRKLKPDAGPSRDRLGMPIVHSDEDFEWVPNPGYGLPRRKGGIGDQFAPHGGLERWLTPPPDEQPGMDSGNIAGGQPQFNQQDIASLFQLLARLLPMLQQLRQPRSYDPRAAFRTLRQGGEKYGAY